MIRLRCLPLLLLTGAFLCGTAAMAQNSTAAVRISTPVDESSLTSLKGNVPALARANYDQGEASSSTQLTHIRLVLSRSSEQQAALDKYLAELQEKSSPNYHKWLTPVQFGKLYGPADSDVAALVAWLESHGFKLEEVSTGRTNIAFSGTVGQVEEAFHTPIHSFEVSGERFYSNTKDPQIPSALATVVAGVAHLNNIKPRPQFIKGQTGQFNPVSKRLEPVNAPQANQPMPSLTTGTLAAGFFLYIVPGDAATIYDTPNKFFNPNYTTGISYTGAGVTIGIGGDATMQETTLASYRSRFLGNPTVFTITNVDGVTSTVDTDEAYIDTELAGALAPAAAIHFYTSTDLNSAIQRAMTDNTVDIFSLSFGLCEQFLTSAQNALINGYWVQAAGQGIAVTVSTGDNGSAGCDFPTDTQGNNVTEAVGGLQVSGYASTPFNIAVGGTDFPVLNGSFQTYVNTSNNASILFRTAKSYIPETTWNNSTQTNTTIAKNVPWPAAIPVQANIVAGSGGKSNCSDNTSTLTTIGACKSGYSKPAWQRGTGVPSDGVRDLPDVSFMSGSGVNPATWLVCTDQTQQNSGGATVTADCTTQSDGLAYFVGFGGTSTAAPAFAGILALVQEKTGGVRLGQAAKELYDLYNSSHAGVIFHDVTVGNISVPCTTGTLDCAANPLSHLFESGYDTTAGYDLATGMGSIDAVQLVTYWGTATGSATATLGITPSATTITTADPLTVTVLLTGSGSLATPTGTVTLSSGSYSSGAQQLTASGNFAFNVPAGSLAIGSDPLTVTYSGDAVYSSATSNTTTIIVTGLTPVVTVTPSATTLNSNAPLPVTVTVTGPSGSPKPSGTVTLSSGTYTSGAQQPTVPGSYSFTIPASSLSAGSNTLTATYIGDAIYAPATNNAVAVTVALSTFTLSAANSTVAIAAGATTGNTSTISVLPVAGFAGTVNLTCVVTTSLSNPTSPVTCSIPASAAVTGAAAVTATLTVSTTSATTVGAYLVTVTATAGNITANTPITVTVSPAGSYLLSNSGALSFSAGSSSGNTSTISVTPSGGFIGAVSLSCVVTTSPAGASSPVTCTTSPTSVSVTSASAVTATLTAATTATTTAGAYAVTVTGTSGGITQTTVVSITVTAATGGGDFTVTATTPGAIATAGGTATSTVTVSSSTGYAGTVTLTCSLTTSPSGATNLPTCSGGSSVVTLSASATSGTATVTVSTTAAVAMVVPPRIRKGPGWLGTAGGAVMAFLVFVGIPARRRNWRSMLGILAVTAALCSLTGCAGFWDAPGSNAGTTAGSYTFTVTGAGSPSVTPLPTTTFTLTVN